MIKNSKFKFQISKRTTDYRFLTTHHGFTLIELLIVMAVIGGLATIFVARFPGSQRRARDTLRKNDLRQYQSGLEVYANRNNGFYPSRTTDVQADTTLCTTDLGLGSGDCSADPRDGDSICTSGLCRYFFRSDGTCALGGPCARNYFLYARLEQPQDTTTPIWFVCSNGESGEVATIPVAGAVCPVP
ncbi:hypothetical protein A2962_04760 [Candidatus Woesebacteria bacterium RIFCSPLOWO2_01_FULL_39_61]|uniref:Type II secretion system protein GspG C-terminal domain-containing protein n=1 Tax=Candidatus Woesebacteria bacterium RIFCSPHIGHO2_02_FULL_39_13 TaxID=1802505 RepID=A0A1F7Z497_9BACT|nr:MAG: hypothetical protein A2692_01080 [Candidatus Woesebacteria bacterium RIFCSPHIGHO2_01_FULL_39_95]OGM34311.1 MAG: hypothetical protein A3D01_00885 [Candidatus Woesebacteria bacterium RIFCSPHIGHO2_02_FULL_39_13]OGM39093.1 MAG: hypothetical protein A3E13_01610 [Candidatus Woesebacteria bacterium RIFCSPHIGHO2_12_FULL_40_20]OGM68648.1 MAG: hypothetical protein A2962_04760 [Candidatus Woesebacteria bacterium RIFCSPLOWO2_01_FULL_39_61]OGM73504.1 MAG: hypothetical protein A3H19_00355 [Candidatus